MYNSNNYNYINISLFALKSTITEILMKIFTKFYLQVYKILKNNENFLMITFKISIKTVTCQYNLQLH